MSFNVTVFDVGQGLSTLLKFNDNTYGIIDCGVGHNCKTNPLIAELDEIKKKNLGFVIKFLIISHFDYDHFSGITEIVKHGLGGHIEKIYCNDAHFRYLLKLFQKYKGDINGAFVGKMGLRGFDNAVAHFSLHRLIAAGKKNDRYYRKNLIIEENSLYPLPINIPGLTGYELLLFSPDSFLLDLAMDPVVNRDNPKEAAKILVGRSNFNWNAGSIVIQLIHKESNRRILFTGDATADTLNFILSKHKGKLAKSDIVIAWHHGGRVHEKDDIKNNVSAWNSVVKSKGHVIISHGCNVPYGHPHNETIDSLVNRNVKVYCTEFKNYPWVDYPLSAVLRHFPGCKLTLCGGSITRIGKHELYPCWGNIKIIIGDNENKCRINIIGNNFSENAPCRFWKNKVSFCECGGQVVPPPQVIP